MVSDGHKLLGAGDHKKCRNPALTPHILGLHPSTEPGGGSRNNIPFDAFMLAQINVCMISSNDTYLLEECTYFLGDENMDTKILHVPSVD